MPIADVSTKLIPISMSRIIL